MKEIKSVEVKEAAWVTFFQRVGSNNLDVKFTLAIEVVRIMPEVKVLRLRRFLSSGPVLSWQLCLDRAGLFFQLDKPLRSRQRKEKRPRCFSSEKKGITIAVVTETRHLERKWQTKPGIIRYLVFCQIGRKKAPELHFNFEYTVLKGSNTWGAKR